MLRPATSALQVVNEFQWSLFQIHLIELFRIFHLICVCVCNLDRMDFITNFASRWDPRQALLPPPPPPPPPPLSSGFILITLVISLLIFAFTKHITKYITIYNNIYIEDRNIYRMPAAAESPPVWPTNPPVSRPTPAKPRCMVCNETNKDGMTQRPCEHFFHQECFKEAKKWTICKI